MKWLSTNAWISQMLEMAYRTIQILSLLLNASFDPFLWSPFTYPLFWQTYDSMMRNYNTRPRKPAALQLSLDAILLFDSRWVLYVRWFFILGLRESFAECRLAAICETSSAENCGYNCERLPTSPQLFLGAASKTVVRVSHHDRKQKEQIERCRNCVSRNS